MWENKTHASFFIYSLTLLTTIFRQYNNENVFFLYKNRFSKFSETRKWTSKQGTLSTLQQEWGTEDGKIKYSQRGGEREKESLGKPGRPLFNFSFLAERIR